MRVKRPDFYATYKKLMEGQIKLTNTDEVKEEEKLVKLFLDSFTAALSEIAPLADEVVNTVNIKPNLDTRYVFSENDEEERPCFKIPDEVLYDETDDVELDHNEECEAENNACFTVPKSIDFAAALLDTTLLMTKVPVSPSSNFEELNEYFQKNLLGKSFVDAIPHINRFYGARGLVRFPQGEVQGIIDVSKGNNQKYLLFVIQPEDDENNSDNNVVLPVVIALFKNTEEEYCAFIPFFGNTLEYGDEDYSLYSKKRHPDYFENKFFKYVNFELLKLNCDCSLIPNTTQSLSENLQSVLKYKMKNDLIFDINEEDKTITIGDVEFKKNSKVAMFKKDKKIPAEKNKCKLAIKINGNVDAKVLPAVSSTICKDIVFTLQKKQELPSCLSKKLSYNAESNTMILYLNIPAKTLNALNKWSNI